MLSTFLLAATALATPLAARGGPDDVEQAFDRAFTAGAQRSSTPIVQPTVSSTVPAPRSTNPLSFEARLASLANASAGRIGVAAVDLSTGHGISVMGDQPSPLASTGKVAIVATFLDGVDQGRYRLTDRYPLMMSVTSRRFSSDKAPVRPGAMLSAEELIELALTRSDNHATDAILAAIGGPQAGMRWVRWIV